MALAKYKEICFSDMKEFVNYFHLENEFKQKYGNINKRTGEFWWRIERWGMNGDCEEIEEAMRELLRKVDGSYIVIFINQDGWGNYFQVIKILD